MKQATMGYILGNGDIHACLRLQLVRQHSQNEHEHRQINVYGHV